MTKVALVATIHPPGSPEDILRCNAWPGSQLCPLITSPWWLKLHAWERERARRASLKCALCDQDEIAAGLCGDCLVLHDNGVRARQNSLKDSK